MQPLNFDDIYKEKFLLLAPFFAAKKLKLEKSGKLFAHLLYNRFQIENMPCSQIFNGNLATIYGKIKTTIMLDAEKRKKKRRVAI